MNLCRVYKLPPNKGLSQAEVKHFMTLGKSEARDPPIEFSQTLTNIHKSWLIMCKHPIVALLFAGDN